MNFVAKIIYMLKNCISVIQNIQSCYTYKVYVGINFMRNSLTKMTKQVYNNSITEAGNIQIVIQIFLLR